MSGEKVWVVVPGQSTTAYLDTEHPASDGDVPTFDAATGLWKTQPGGGGGAPDIDNGTTAETDTAKVLAPDGAGGVDWVTPSAPGAPDIDAGTTAETDTSLVLAPDGAGGVAWVASGGGTASVYHDGQWQYNFATQGGSQATHALTAIAGEATIPNHAYIVDGFLVGQTVLASATDGAGVSVDIEGVGDLVSPSSPSGFGFSIPGAGPLSSFIGSDGKRFASNANIDHSASSFINTTASRTPAVTITFENVTQGKFQLFLRWVVV